MNLYSQKALQELLIQSSTALHLDLDSLRLIIAELLQKLESYREEKAKAKEVSVASKQAGTIIKVPELQANKALRYLKQKRLWEVSAKDLKRIGISGEAVNLELLFYTMTSRLLPNPLHAVIHASSGSGKSVLMEAVAGCMPGPHQLEITSMTGKSFYHWGKHELRHKLLLIQDWFSLDAETEYLIRELQSKQKVSRVLTTRDEHHALTTQLKEVHGPVSIVAATTQPSIYEDNANRSIQLYLNEEDKQDERILKRQRAILAGKANQAREQWVQAQFRAAQALLKPYPVRIPFAMDLLLPSVVQHKRRMNSIYLNLIASVTLWHQYQRTTYTDEKTGTTYLYSSLRDVEVANALAVTLLTPKSDLLPVASRQFLDRLGTWLKRSKRVDFNSPAVVQGLRMHPSKVKRYLKTLLSFGSIQIVGGDRYRGGYVYQLNAQGTQDRLAEQIAEFLENNLKSLRYSAKQGKYRIPKKGQS